MAKERHITKRISQAEQYPADLFRQLVDKSLALGVSMKKDIITEEEVMAASREL